MTTGTTAQRSLNGQTSRVHIALAVKDIGASMRFYERLFGTAPMKVKDRYAKFAPSGFAVNLALNEVKGAVAKQAAPAHFGMQVDSTEIVKDANTRMEADGYAGRVEEQTTCCYAVQDKVWFSDPDGNDWEVFVVLEDAEAYAPPDGNECCVPKEKGSCCG